MMLFRNEIETLEQNGITHVAMARIADETVLPLWFGEGDIITPEFIRYAAKQALDEGYTFYGHIQGRSELRNAIKEYLAKLYGVDIDLERITVPGSTMLGITTAAQMALTTGLHGLIVSPCWPNIDRNFQITGAKFDFVRQHYVAGRWSLDLDLKLQEQNLISSANTMWQAAGQLDLDELLKAVKPHTKAIFINTPCNPTMAGMAPGYTFGPDNEAHFRLCFALSHDRLKEALKRTVCYIDRHDHEYEG